MEYYGLTEVGSSGINADSYYISQDRKIFAISDGASGAFDKIGAGTICMDTIKELDYLSMNLKPHEYIISCINESNSRLIKKSQQDGFLTFGTMTMVVIEDNKLSIRIVGDTHSFLIQEDKIKKIIKPKKKFTKLIEVGILTEEEVNKAILSIPNVM